MKEKRNLWGGRFTGATDEGFAAFNRSFGFDRRLFAADVRAIAAHCAGLRAAGALDEDEAARISEGLREIMARGAAEGAS